jgi:hypothetical protein
MYLAKHVGRWSTPQIGRFYNGRQHTTVLYAIQKIEHLREQDGSVNALLEVLTLAVNPRLDESLSESPETVIEAIAARVTEKLIAMQQDRTTEGPIMNRMQDSVADLTRENPATVGANRCRKPACREHR